MDIYLPWKGGTFRSFGENRRREQSFIRDSCLEWRGCEDLT
jgi:hypothetical protein